MIENLSWCCASIGSGSQTRTPGTLVSMAPNSPRISAGASGLGSKLSMWLMPPWSQIRMHETSGPVASAEARARRNSGSPSPNAASDPTRKASRRVTPSQLRFDPRISWNIGTPCGGHRHLDPTSPPGSHAGSACATSFEKYLTPDRPTCKGETAVMSEPS